VEKGVKIGNNFFKACWYCIKLSYDASKLYTIFRLLYSTVSALLTIALAYVGKNVIDMLAHGSEEKSLQKIVGQLILLTILTAIQLSGNKMSEYVIAMHSDVLRTKVRMQMMGVSATADLEFFDSTKFYNAFESVKNDSYSIISIVWNLMTFVSTFITMCSAMIVIGKVNILFRPCCIG